MKITIYDLDKYPLSERNGTYGGNAGSKEGIKIDDTYWLVKYPKSTKGMSGTLVSYANTPLSEYIGSHIYELLGYDTHKTILGVRNGKLVVACKDFCKEPGSLREIRTIKNIYNQDLEEKLEDSFSSTKNEHTVDLEQLLIHFDYNPVLKNIEGLKERFWEQVIIDGLINNNDRNNGNWGLLYEDGKYQLAPVFDNGACLYNKTADEKLEEILSDEPRFNMSCLNITTAFSVNDKQLSFKEILNRDDKNLKAAILRTKLIIETNLKNINDFIDGIPAQISGLYVCSDVRKEYYKKSIELRFKKIIEPKDNFIFKSIISRIPVVDKFSREDYDENEDAEWEAYLSKNDKDDDDLEL